MWSTIYRCHFNTKETLSTSFSLIQGEEDRNNVVCAMATYFTCNLIVSVQKPIWKVMWSSLYRSSNSSRNKMLAANHTLVISKWDSIWPSSVWLRHTQPHAASVLDYYDSTIKMAVHVFQCQFRRYHFRMSMTIQVTLGLSGCCGSYFPMVTIFEYIWFCIVSKHSNTFFFPLIMWWHHFTVKHSIWPIINDPWTL